MGHFHTPTWGRHAFCFENIILSEVVGVKFLSVFLPLNLSSIYKAELHDVYSSGISLLGSFTWAQLIESAQRIDQGVSLASCTVQPYPSVPFM
jgi:hypothetical protein